jgi:phosphomannomutase
MSHHAVGYSGTSAVMKKLVIFDLDGTLAESKSPLDAEMATLLVRLLDVVQVAIISGGAWPQFEKQILPHLPQSERLKSLSLLPTCGTRYYRWTGIWKLLYAENFSAAEKEVITAALNKALEASGLRPNTHWGDQIEDRGSQITFSALGQEAPLDEKEKWDPGFEKRKKIVHILKTLIPTYSTQLGGSTSIDINRPGIDKAYGVKKLRAILDISIADMIFIGDAIFPGGNDYPAKETGVLSVAVRDPHETKRVIEAIIACLGD